MVMGYFLAQRLLVEVLAQVWGKGEGKAELETEVPGYGHKVAVHTQGTFTGTHLTFTQSISFSKVGP